MNRISDISTNIGSGMTPSRRNKDFWNSNDIMWLKSEQLGDFTIENTNEYISNIALEKTKIKLWEKGTISIAMYGEGKTRGKVSILDNKMATNQAICNIETDKTKADNFFLYYWLVLNYKSLRNISNGVRNNLNTDDIRNFSFPNINLLEQKKISNTLLLLDKKIKLNNKINDNLEAMANGIYMHTFFSKKPTGKLKDILIEAEKSLVQVNESKASTGNFPFFTSGMTVLKWSTSFIDGRNCFLNTGGNADVKFYVGKAAYSADTWCISANGKMSDYLYLLLSSIKPELYQKFFQGTGLKHLQKPLLKDRPIYIPKRSELENFNKQIMPMFNIISANKRENEQLINLRNFLLPMLMNGQATISD